MKDHYYPVIEYKNIVAIGMLKTNQTYLSFEEIELIAKQVERNLAEANIIGKVCSAPYYVADFAKEYGKQFDVDAHGVHLRENYDTQWLIDNIVNNITITELQYFGFFTRKRGLEK